MIDFFLWAAAGLMLAGAIYLFKRSDTYEQAKEFEGTLSKISRSTGGRRRGVSVEADLPRAKARTRKKEVVMFKKVVNAALRKAEAKTRSGGQIGVAAGSNFAKCLLKELAKEQGSKVLALVESYK